MRMSDDKLDFLNFPISEKREYLEQHPEIIDKVLKEGTEKARKEAAKTMKRVKEAMKLDYFEE